MIEKGRRDLCKYKCIFGYVVYTGDFLASFLSPCWEYC